MFKTTDKRQGCDRSMEYDSRLTATSLRTVPVIVKSGDRKLKINALLDDSSSRSYVNASVVKELGLTGRPRKLQVGVLNGVIQNINSHSAELGLESVDGKVDVEVNVLTVDKVVGDMQVTDWNDANQWNHLRDIPFPGMAHRRGIDMLIGVDQASLQFSIKEVIGHYGEPIARLTPLGWTCVGKQF